jgi:hypothetical protein
MSTPRPVRTPAGVVHVQPVGATRGDAHVRVVAVDTWSVMRTGFVLSLSFAIVIVVAVTVLWTMFSIAGVFDAVGRTADDIAGANSSFDVRDWLSFPRVMGLTLLVSVVEVVLVTAAMTLIASLYNLAAGWMGGIEIGLSEQR